jgi:uncharacterized membrane protein
MMTSFSITGRDNGGTQPSQSLPHPKGARHDTNVGTLERWGSVIGGAALAAYGMKRRSLGGTALAILGAGLLSRGMTGYCQLYRGLGINTAKPDGESRLIEVESAITIEKSPEELYSFWRQFDNLPRFMAHLEAVQSTGDGRSHWIATAPMGMTAEWDAEITEERHNELIAWRSLDGARIPNQGRVRFQRAPGGRGTEVRVTLAYRPPMGKLGAAIAKLFGEEPQQQLAEDLRRLKSVMETGEIPTIEGQPSGRVRARREELAYHGRRLLASSHSRDAVEEASKESIPASDASTSTFKNRGA